MSRFSRIASTTGRGHGFPNTWLAMLLVGVLASPASAQLLLETPAATVPVTFPLLPSGGQIVDLDGNGMADLVCHRSTNLDLQLQQASGFTRSVVPFTSGGLPILSVAVADLDADGNMDLVVATGDLVTRVHWGDGTNTWPSPSPFTIAGYPGATTMRVRVADVDTDGDGDLVLVYSRSGFIPGTEFGHTYLVLNQGSRTFLAAPAGTWPDSITHDCEAHVLDVDGDGAKDCLFVPYVAGNGVAVSGTARLYWNNGGTFVMATTAQLPTIQGSFQNVLCDDLDADGDLDLVLAGGTGPGVMLRTVGVRQLVVAATSVTPPRTYELEAADVDGDSDTDLVLLTHDGIELLANDGTGAFARQDFLGDNANVQLVLRGDLDQDGDPDFVRIGTNYSNPTPTLRTSVAYTVLPGRLQLLGGMPIGFNNLLFAEPTDLDGDHLVDLGVRHTEVSSNTFQVLRNRGEGSFVFEPTNRVAPDSVAFTSFFADLDGNGRPDWVQLGLNASFPSRYYLNVGGRLDESPSPLPTLPFGFYASGGAVDLDGDLDQDLVVAVRIGSWSVLRLLENQAGTFVDATATRINGPAQAGSGIQVVAADLDGDGDLDVWSQSSTESFVWRNQGGVLTFVPGAVTVNGFGGGTGQAADLDGDGDVDLQSGPILRWNRGDGTFVTDLVALAGLSTFGSYRLQDLDDDGDVDIYRRGLVRWNLGGGTFTQGPSPTSPSLSEEVDFVGDIDLDGDPDAVVRGFPQPLILTNRLRQLELLGSGRLGETLELRYETNPGQQPLPVLAWLGLAFETTPPTWLPGLGWARIDPLVAIPIGPFALPGTGGSVSIVLNVPNSASLKGTLLAAQPLESRGNRMRIGNLVTQLLGR